MSDLPQIALRAQTWLGRLQTRIENLIVGRIVPDLAFDYWQWAAKLAPTEQALPEVGYRHWNHTTGRQGQGYQPFNDYLAAGRLSNGPITASLDSNEMRPICEHLQDGSKVHITSDLTKDCILKGLKLSEVAIENSRANIRIERCYVGRLVISNPGSNNTTLSIFRSAIGEIDLSGASISSIKAEDVVLSRIEASTASRAHILGRVRLSKVWLAARHQDGAGEVQDLRTLRTQLSRMNNTLAAGVIHSAEMNLERATESWPNKVVSWIYGFFSDYGNSVGRPLIWLIVCWGTAALAIHWFDAAVPNSDSLSGWQLELKQAEWLRAGILPAITILNPLGVFGKSILVARTWMSSVLLSLWCLLGTLCIALAVIAIRRRFRLE